MTQLQQFLFELSFGQTRKIREYMLKRYNVYCGSMKDLERAINDYIPNEDILEGCQKYWHDRRVLHGRMAERIHGISGSTPLAGTINLTRE